MKQAQHLLVSFLVFTLVMSAGIYQFRSYQALHVKGEQQHLANKVQAQALLIDKALTRALDATYILAQEVRRTRGEVEDFESLADRLVASNRGVTNLQLAPGGILQRIHPLAGNQKAIGHNLLRDDRRRNAAREAVDSGLITLAGPFKLIQGGVGVVARNPVFLESDGKQDFWGFASALILLEDLYATTDIPQLRQQGYFCQLLHDSPETDQVDRFPDIPLPADYLSYSVSFSVPNDTWTLTLSKPQTDSIMNEILYYIIWIGFSLLLSAATYNLLRRPIVLAQTVRKRTQELEEANLRYKRLSNTDPLTKIPNRRAYEERIGIEVSAAKRSDQTLSLLMVDIDYFKKFNDHHGHDAGDMALRRVAEEIIGALPRSTDFAARFGGEEFVILLPSTDSDGAYLVAERIRLRVMSLGITHDYSDGIGMVSVSIGVASLSGTSMSENELLKRADSAMYTAKRTGRNRCVVFASVRRERPKSPNVALRSLKRE